MKALLMRLSAIDSDAEAALRIIEYFDALTVRGASTDMVVRGAAALGETVAGLRLPSGDVLRYDVSGERLEPRRAAGDYRVHVRGDLSAWLEREGPAHKFDDLMLERFSLAAQSAVVDKPPLEAVVMADAGLVETLLSQREPPEERSIAVRRLGIPSTGQIVVLAIAGPAVSSGSPAGVPAVIASLQRLHLVRAAAIGTTLAVIVHQHAGTDARAAVSTIIDELPGRRAHSLSGVRIGMSEPLDGLDAHRGWASANVALRFAPLSSDAPRAVDAGALGILAPLVSIDVETWESSADVRVLRELSETESGRIDIAVLEAYLAHGSLRQAGVVLHMHHSSIGSRLARMEERLDLDLSVPADAFKARLSLLALVLIQTAVTSTRQ